MASVSTLGQSLEQVERLKVLQTQLSTLQSQLTTGKKTDLFKGLGTDVITSKKSRANFNALDNYLTNIETATRRISMTTNLIEEVKAQSENLLGSLELQTQQGEYEIEALGQFADNLQGFIFNLLNEKDGDRYLLAGANTLTKPLSNTGTLDTYTTNQIEDWVNGVITTDEFMNSYKDKAQLTDTIVGYSAEIASGQSKSISVRVDDNAEIDYTVMANADPFRDILVAISMIKNIDAVIDEVTLEDDDPAGTITAPGSTKQEKNDNFYKVFNDLAAMLNRGLDQIDTERFKLAQAQTQITQIADNHKVEKNMLATTISNAEDVDINEVAVKLNALTIQLEASYRVTATISNLNLASFLS
ncbi:MAG: flagellin [Micavibrio sp.]